MNFFTKAKRYMPAAKNAILKPSQVTALPVHMQLEPTTFCNLDCLSCPRSAVITTPRHMPLERFKEVISTLRPLHLMLSGLGEPLLHPDIGRFIQFATGTGCKVNLTSNGTFLAKRAAELAASGLDLLSISLDADSLETYEHIRKNGAFEAVADGIRTFNELRKKENGRRPGLRLHFVIHAGNIHRLSSFVQFAKDLGADTLYFQPLDLTGLSAERVKELSGGLSYADIVAKLKAARAQAQDVHIVTNLDYVIGLFDRFWNKYLRKDIPFTQCMLPWISAYVTVDGNLRPCCSFAFPECEWDMGNVFETPFAELYNSQKYRAFRRTLRQGKAVPPTCRNCVPKSPGYLAVLSAISPGFIK